MLPRILLCVGLLGEDMKMFVALVLCGLVAGCAAPSPSVGPISIPTTTPPTSTQSSPPSASPASALVPDAFGDISFIRPSSWQKVRPAVQVAPGPLLWLSSVALDPACTRAATTSAMSCMPGRVLPDGGAFVAFGTGGTLVQTAATPLPVRQVADDACTAAGGHMLTTRIEAFYIGACLRGPSADAAFDAFYASLRIDN